MKKTILLALFAFLSTFGFAQNPKTHFKICYTGDSNSQSCYITCDSLWTYKLDNIFRQYYDTVTAYHLAIGGRTIGSFMPSYYTSAPWPFCQSDASVNITTMLSYNADLNVITWTSNHFANGMPCDTVIKLFKWAIDTLRGLNKKFVLTSIYPRQRLWQWAGVDQYTYRDSCLKFDAWLKTYAPKERVDIWTALYDTLLGYKMFSRYMRPDSLHTLWSGSDKILEGHLDNFIIDSCLADIKCKSYNTSLVKIGGNLRLSGISKYRAITVSVSNDYANFTRYKRFVSPNNNLQSYNKIFPDIGYVYYKIEIFTGRRRTTKTYQIN